MNAAMQPRVDEALFSVLRGRRTVHDFEPGTIPAELVLQALDAARWAPNHHRTEPWRVYLLGSQAQATIAMMNAASVRAERGERAAEIKLARWTAMPNWMVMTSPLNDDQVREREDYAACCCAAQNFMLALWSAGIGVKWTTGKVVNEPKFAETVGFNPRDEQVVGLFWYGKPARIIEQHRRDVDSFVVHVD